MEWRAGRRARYEYVAALEGDFAGFSGGRRRFAPVSPGLSGHAGAYMNSYVWLLPLLLPSARADEDVPSRPLHCPSAKNGVGLPVLVETELGLINGTRCGHLDHFLGVYYAEPPLGPLRFRPAMPKKKWAPRVMDATWSAAVSCPSPTHSPMQG